MQDFLFPFERNLSEAKRIFAKKHYNNIVTHITQRIPHLIMLLQINKVQVSLNCIKNRFNMILT